MKRIAFAALAALALAGCQDVAPDKLTAPDEANLSQAVSISLDCPASVMVGQVTTCSAWAYDAQGLPSYINPSTWSSNPSILSVSGTVIQGHSVGNVTVTAMYDGLHAFRTVKVVAPPQAATITLSPTSATVRVGAQHQFTATVKDQYGNTLSGQTVAWSTANTAVATVNASGKVTGQGLGTTTLTASVGSATATATITGAHAVSATGPDLAYDETVQVTATALPAGSYYYEWSIRTCTQVVPCGYTYTAHQAGQNLTSVPVYVSRHNTIVNVRVRLKASSTGAVLASATHAIYGAGEPLPPGDPDGCFPRDIC